MPRAPELAYSPPDLGPDLLARAASVLAREMARLPATALGGAGMGAGAPPLDMPQLPGLPAVTDLGGRVCPVTGAKVPLPGEVKAPVGEQAHGLLGALLAGLGQGGSIPDPVQALAGSSPLPSPLGGASPVPAQALGDNLRKQAHEFLETLLVTLNEATGDKGLPAEDKVPLIQCAAPAEAGTQARATLTVANDEPTPSTVSLYCTNFATDSGHEIPSLRVSVSPRTVTIPARGQAAFEIRIAIPQQAPAGDYSGLIQAMGSKYVKAVLTVTVL